MAKVYFDENGRPSAVPAGKTEAKRHNHPLYKGPTACTECGKQIFHVKNDKCLTCGRLEAIAFYNYIIGIMTFRQHAPDKYVADFQDGSHIPIEYDNADTFRARIEATAAILNPAKSRGHATETGAKCFVTPDPCRKAGHYGVQTLQGHCYFCEKEKNTVSPRQQAIRDGQTTYIPLTPCPYCGQVAPKRVNGGQCSGCSDRRRQNKPVSPRQQAIRDGQTTYIPLTPCPYCGQTAPKRVDNGRCSGCVS